MECEPASIVSIRVGEVRSALSEELKASAIKVGARAMAWELGLNGNSFHPELALDGE